MSQFKWNAKKQKAAISLAEGQTQQAAGDIAGVTRKTIYRWLQEPEFSEEVDRLTLTSGVALKAERIRLVKRIIAARVEKSIKETNYMLSKADTLDILKYLQGETEAQRIEGDFSQSIVIEYADIGPEDEIDVAEATSISKNGHKRVEPV